VVRRTVIWAMASTQQVGGIRISDRGPWIRDRVLDFRSALHALWGSRIAAWPRFALRCF